MMRFKLPLLITGVVLSLSISGVASEGVNPFYPIFSSSSGGGAKDPYLDNGSTEGIHPLQQRPVKDYILMGVLSSASGQIALIRAKNGEEYFIRKGDLLGNANGEIGKINTTGIEINEKDKVISLLVRNRSASNEKSE